MRMRLTEEHVLERQHQLKPGSLIQWVFFETSTVKWEDRAA